MPTQVRKRDGTLQTFNPVRIGSAIYLAFRALTPMHMPSNLQELEDKVVERLVGDVVDIEHIQDTVEQVLMEDHPGVAKAYVLYRAERARVRGLRTDKTPDPNAVADYIHPAKYGKWLSDKKRREVYSETVDRSKSMHFTRLQKMNAPLAVYQMLDEAFERVYSKRVLPSMRSMQFGGEAVLIHNARLYNCAFTLADRPRVFQEVLYLLLCGSGVGFSVQFQHVEKLPPISKINKYNVRHYTVRDTIEGWADSVGALMDAFFTGYWVEFDYTCIRPEGSPLVVSGGKAPGHIPLKRLHQHLWRILDKAQGRKLRPIEVHDCMCHIAEAVLAGGIRRSSLISLFSADDGEMMYAKTPHNFQFQGLNAQREMANNSAVLIRDHVTQAQFKRLFDTANMYYGEPGFFFTNNPDYGCNPCGEIGLWPIDTTTGQTGFSFCNLCEINAAACKTEADFYDACRAAAIIGTAQATYTNFPYLGEVTERIVRREALLGIGITGMTDNPSVALRPEVQQRGAAIVKETNAKMARMLGINAAARTTTVKPSGTASLELGCVGSGIHPHHARRYFRRVTANPLEPVAKFFKQYNPHMVEVKPNGDWSLVFPIQAPVDAITSKEQPALDFLGQVIKTYKNWVCEGTANPDSAPGLTHNVSSTVVVSDGEWDAVFNYVWEHRNEIAAMTFLPRFSDKGIPFVPREEVVTELDEQKWSHLISNYKPVPYDQMVEEADGTAHTMEPACAGGACDITQSSLGTDGDGTVLCFLPIKYTDDGHVMVGNRPHTIVSRTLVSAMGQEFVKVRPKFA